MRVVTPPNKARYNTETIFLAGGITHCSDWQSEVIEHLNDILSLQSWDAEDLSIFNPRVENFPIDDPTAAEKQIRWEFDALESCGIFSMYFCNSTDVQPICMYELGRNIIRIQQKFPKSWKNRIIVSVEDGYAREEDVVIQCSLAGIMVYKNATPLRHAQALAKAWSIVYG